MKTVYFSLLALMIVIFPVYSQEKTNELGTIVGAWAIDMGIQEVAISKNLGFNSDSLSHEMRESLDQIMRSKLYMFSNEGLVRISWTSHGVEMVVDGLYELNENQKLSLAVDERRITYRISLDGNKLILIPEEVSKGMIERIYLKRLGS